MKVYKTIKIEEIERYQGWDLDRVFTQRLLEQVMEQESHPNTSYQGAFPNLMSVQKYKETERMFALLSKDAEVASREAALEDQVSSLSVTITKLKNEHEELQLKLTQCDTDRIAYKDRVKAECSRPRYYKEIIEGKT